MAIDTKVVTVVVYGAQQLCATCLHLPSSEETAEWLRAALVRDYGEAVQVKYVDIAEPENQSDPYVRDILANEYAYPLVVIADEVVGEGNPRLKTIRHKLAALGLERKG